MAESIHPLLSSEDLEYSHDGNDDDNAELVPKVEENCIGD